MASRDLQEVFGVEKSTGRLRLLRQEVYIHASARPSQHCSLLTHARFEVSKTGGFKKPAPTDTDYFPLRIYDPSRPGTANWEQENCRRYKGANSRCSRNGTVRMATATFSSRGSSRGKSWVRGSPEKGHLLKHLQRRRRRRGRKASRERETARGCGESSACLGVHLLPRPIGGLPK